ncbi:MAG: type II toxin-antitoxin system VapC family toxin [Candidatus Methanosuratincola sp.]
MVDPEAYVDANVFVYWLGNHPAHGRTALELVRRMEGAVQKRYVTSSLTVYEVLVIVAGLTGKNLRDRKLVEAVGSISELPGLRITPLIQEDLEDAPKLMDEYALDYEDALHLAAALRNGSKEIISNDRDFDRTPLRRSFE